MKQSRFGKAVEMTDTVGETPFVPLEPAEQIRLRPGMYIGGVNTDGLHYLFKEVIDNAIDEAMAGHCTKIKIVYGADHSLSVEDNGRGIPVEVDKETNKSFVEAIFTEIQWPRRYYAGGYKTSAGFNGVGVCCVNVLSAWLECEVRRGGKVYRQRFERGVPTGPLSGVGTCGSEEHGTKVTWLADASIFTQAVDDAGNVLYDVKRLRERIRELAFLNKGLTVSFHDAHGSNAPEVCRYERGIAGYVSELTAGKEVLHSDVICVSCHEEGTQADVVFQFRQDADEEILCFANSYCLASGGTPYTGFKQALTRLISRYARKHGFIGSAHARFSKDNVRDGSMAMAALAYPNLSGMRRFSENDLGDGLSAVIAVRLANPCFPGATKDRLANPEVGELVDRAISKVVSTFLDANPTAASAILAKACEAANARKAA